MPAAARLFPARGRQQPVGLGFELLGAAVQNRHLGVQIAEIAGEAGKRTAEPINLGAKLGHRAAPIGNRVFLPRQGIVQRGERPLQAKLRILGIRHG